MELGTQFFASKTPTELSNLKRLVRRATNRALKVRQIFSRPFRGAKGDTATQMPRKALHLAKFCRRFQRQ